MRFILIALLLSGCLNTKGIFTTGSSTGAAVVGTAVGGPVLGAAAGVTAGITTEVLVEEPVVVRDISDLPPEEQASIIKTEQWVMFFTTFWKWIVGGVLAWFFFPLIIGYLIPNGRQRMMQKDMDKRNKLRN